MAKVKFEAESQVGFGVAYDYCPASKTAAVLDRRGNLYLLKKESRDWRVVWRQCLGDRAPIAVAIKDRRVALAYSSEEYGVEIMVNQMSGTGLEVFSGYSFTVCGQHATQVEIAIADAEHGGVMVCAWAVDVGQVAVGDNRGMGEVTRLDAPVGKVEHWGNRILVNSAESLILTAVTDRNKARGYELCRDGSGQWRFSDGELNEDWTFFQNAGTRSYWDDAGMVRLISNPDFSEGRGYLLLEETEPVKVVKVHTV